MDPTVARTRRTFLGAVGTLSVGSLAASRPVQREQVTEYGLHPTPVYLNAASLGPTPRTVLDRTLSAWAELEHNPVRMAYSDGAVHVATCNARQPSSAAMPTSSSSREADIGTALAALRTELR